MSDLYKQSAAHVMVMEPAGFHSNPETRESNSYQHDDPDNVNVVQAAAAEEFRVYRDKLVSENIAVTTVMGRAESPDDVFCNNWVSTHRDADGNGQIVLYPMLAPNRRLERRADMLALLGKMYDTALDLSAAEAQGIALEATGCLAMDRVNRVAYMTRSARMDEGLAKRFAETMGYELVMFNTMNHAGKPVYHTDVMLYFGTGYAGICLDAIVPEDRARVEERLRDGGKRELVEISMDQLRSFCGNSLQLIDADGKPVLAMSSAAHAAYTESQKATLLKCVDRIIHSDLGTIEKYGGGSARCMLLEMF